MEVDGHHLGATIFFFLMANMLLSINVTNDILIYTITMFGAFLSAYSASKIFKN